MASFLRPIQKKTDPDAYNPPLTPEQQAMLDGYTPKLSTHSPQRHRPRGGRKSPVPLFPPAEDISSLPAIPDIPSGKAPGPAEFLDARLPAVPCPWEREDTVSKRTHDGIPVYLVDAMDKAAVAAEHLLSLLMTTAVQLTETFHNAQRYGSLPAATTVAASPSFSRLFDVFGAVFLHAEEHTNACRCLGYLCHHIRDELQAVEQAMMTERRDDAERITSSLRDRGFITALETTVDILKGKTEPEEILDICSKKFGEYTILFAEEFKKNVYTEEKTCSQQKYM